MPDPTNLVQVIEMPSSGCFFSMQLNPSPPWPCDPYPDLTLYSSAETPGQYWYDDRSIDYAALRRHHHRHNGTSGAIVMSAEDVPMPGDGGDDDGGSGGGVTAMVTWNPPASGYTPCQTWTNAWIHLENSSTANEVIGIISNTLPGIDYILLCKTNLTDAVWTPIQVLTATGSITPFTVATADPNSLFFWAVLATNSAAPVIISPPSNQVVAAGGSATFSVTAQGYPAVGYQWFHDGTTLPGATASTLTIPSVNSNNVGSYTVLVTNVICEASATGGGTWCGPGGLDSGSADPFLSNAPDFSLIAFVGPNPYCDSNGVNRWGDSTYFPQLAGSNGYYAVTNSQGTNWVFTTTRSGYLWFGFNDDSIKEVIGDNYGSVAGQIIITNEP